MAQETSRLFLGPELCRDQHWLQTIERYLNSFFAGIDLLDSCPPLLRPLVAKFSSTGKRVRSNMAEASRILSRFILKRRTQQARGEIHNDLLQWFDDGARGAPYDPTIFILRAFLAAIHSTSDLLTKTILEICAHPDLIDDLREEAARVFKQHGLKKTAIHELRLMDSVIKETQRIKPLQTSASQLPSTPSCSTKDFIKFQGLTPSFYA